VPKNNLWCIEIFIDSVQVEKLCLYYGPLIGHIGDRAFHDFPPPEALTGPGVETHLKELGFGYRAKYVAKTAAIVTQKPPGWLESLSNSEDAKVGAEIDVLKSGGRPGYRKAHEQLLELQGVGPKVADCVCLFGLGWGESLPVDTHVWQIAQRDYKFGKGKHKSLTPATYDAIGNHFRGLWGVEAGWAHSVLFAADLRTFSDRLTTKVELEVEETKVKLEDGTVDIKVKEEVKVEVEEAKRKFKQEPAIESPRDQRAKRRR
jgi:N-glycosylase/DNA lyase